MIVSKCKDVGSVLKNTLPPETAEGVNTHIHIHNYLRCMCDVHVKYLPTNMLSLNLCHQPHAHKLTNTVGGEATHKHDRDIKPTFAFSHPFTTARCPPRRQFQHRCRIKELMRKPEPPRQFVTIVFHVELAG